MEQPKLVIVTGRPAAGKSTLAKWLSQELKLPLVSKDNIREVLFERFKARSETGNRHPGHGDNDVLGELYKNLTDEKPQVLDIGGLVIEVDTTDFEKINYQAILKQVRSVLAK